MHHTILTNFPLEINDTLSSNVDYIEEVDDDDDDSSDRSDRPLVTLPYTEEVIVDQPYASRVENVNPFNVFAFIGNIVLLPASDDWVSTRRLPTRVTRIEGNFLATVEDFVQIEEVLLLFNGVLGELPGEVEEEFVEEDGTLVVVLLGVEDVQFWRERELEQPDAR